MAQHLYLIGYPGDIGGACTETWHTLKLWRRFGVEVTAIPTWKAEPRWRKRLEGIGVKTEIVKPGEFKLPVGSVVVSFCNEPFLQLATDGRLDGCRTIWVPCMTYLLSSEKRYLTGGGKPFDRYVFQSLYQKELIGAELAGLGVTVDRFHLVRGFLDVTEFPFRPKAYRPRNGGFVIGRLSRDDPRKFHVDTWKIYGQIPHAKPRVMGFGNGALRRCGYPPPGVEALPKGAEPTQVFLASLHAIVHCGGEAVENWPRFALEAMAAGVPVVTDNRGGTREMLTHGLTGLLCDNPREFVEYTTRLAGDEQWRLGMARHARLTVERVLCEPNRVWRQWQSVFGGLGENDRN